MKSLKLRHFFLLPGLWLLSSWCQASLDQGGFDQARSLYQNNDYRAAFEAFNALADQGDPRAQTVVALMYKFGEGVEQDLKAAFAWYQKAAQQGYAPAQFHTGTMLADGLGTTVDREAALFWLNLAADNGFPRAIDKLAELNASAEALGKQSDELITWSQDWDLKLPSEFVLGEPEVEVPVPSQRYFVQVGAMGTQSAANKLWEVLTSHHPNLFQTLSPRITLAESRERRVYRIHTGPFTDFQSADEFCGRLMASTIQAGCLPVKID